MKAKVKVKISMTYFLSCKFELVLLQHFLKAVIFFVKPHVFLICVVVFLFKFTVPFLD